MRAALVLIALVVCGANAADAAPPAEGDLHGLWKSYKRSQAGCGHRRNHDADGRYPNGFLDSVPIIARYTS